MSFRYKQDSTYTKYATIQKFEYQKNGYPYTDLQRHIETGIKNLGDQEIKIKSDIHFRCRKVEHKTGMTCLFVSFFDKRAEISTTMQKADDNITKVGVNNADEKHLFFCVKNHEIASMQTIDSRNNMKSNLHHVVSAVLKYAKVPNKNLEVLDALDGAKLKVLQEEKLRHILVSGEFDLMGLGMPQTSFFDKVLGKTNTAVKLQNATGVLTIGRNGGAYIFEEIEKDPLHSINSLDDSVVFITRQGKRITCGDMLGKKKYFFEPVGKTKTIVPLKAFNALEDFM